MGKATKIAILGLGTVGGGVYKVLEMQKEEMERKLGSSVEVAHILVRNLEKAAAKVADPSILTNDIDVIINDPEVRIVVEVMGGIEPAKTYILKALKAGKNVVTANKDLLASEGQILMDTAGENHCDLFYEAAVAGGIPIIGPLKLALAGNHVAEVMGIVNGTTNFILTRMTRDGMEFSDALKLAQELGFAESDPTADVEGLDAGRKMAILACAAFNSRVTFDNVHTEGISGITARDIRYAKEMGHVIKLLGVARNTERGIEVMVHPMLIDESHPLAAVNDSYNAVFVRGDAVQDTMFYGRGAGELPTASAVVGDIFEIVRNIDFNCCGRIGCTCYKQLPVVPYEETCSKYFIRIKVEDRNGVLASIAAVFGNNNVSIEQMVQRRKQEDFAELVLITESVKEKNLKDALTILRGMSIVKKVSNVIRVAQ
ncbi:MAG: homoserine dehydrogenase [Eubacteriales bacterium]|nr:homoserine dehydrogenase [Eubacteriales bacterium]